ncbi:hypothetical protein E2C01_038096 [Portunus trituberculatus]|uniref:Uncharacterized protein n=1 Tax=Portunus trituberculatus TaxID=210409 RepID=A0A5B7FH37_PORTR|nr:hypothetical protein [Portunus trituberculatus]
MVIVLGLMALITRWGLRGALQELVRRIGGVGVMRVPAEGKVSEPGEERECLWRLSEGDPPIFTVTVIT